MKLKGLLSLALVFGCLPGMASAGSQIYTWTDSNGNPVFSQEGGSIPMDRDVHVIFLPSPREPEPAPVEVMREVIVPVQTSYSLPTVKAEVNGVADLDFVVDTGASVTVLTRELAEDLGIDVDRLSTTRTLETARGTITAPEVRLSNVAVGDASIDDLVAVVIDSEGVPNLLGRNFLNHFQVTLDPREQVLILRPPSTR